MNMALSLQLNLDGSNEDNTKVRAYPIRVGITSDQGGVYVPEYGVFHPDSIVVKHLETNTTLVKNRDYYLTYYSRHLKLNYSIDGCAGIVLTNRALTGNLQLSANFLGGGYVRFNPTYVVDVVNLISGIPEQLFWDNVLDAPVAVNPNSHKLPAPNITTGYQDMTSVLWLINQKIKDLVNIRNGDKIPVGTILETACADDFFNDNSHWLYMLGQTIKREDYPLLFIGLGVPLNQHTYKLPARENHIIRTV